MKISGYITTKNCVSMDYPFEAAIRSLLDFCDEVVVADSSNKDDGTLDVLQKLVDEDERVNVYQVDVPWDAPNHGIYDGQMKAFARNKCTGDFLFQLDSDECVQPGFRPVLESFLKKVNNLKDVPLAALPVIEYWGGPDKVRIDVNPWKWRISRNIPNITHGIPAQLRWYKDGLLYSRHGSDGCDYIYASSGDPVPCLHFVTNEVESIRRQAITKPEQVAMYEFWLQSVSEQLPTVYHFSWWSIAAKIKKFRGFWNDSWLSLYGEKSTKPPEWNPFFADKALKDVTDEEINALAKRLATETGGHIFHGPWNGSKTNSAKIEQPIPGFIQEWADKHRDIK